MQKSTQAPIDVDANDVWAAACSAIRINGDYIKFAGDSVESNRTLVLNHIANPSLIQDQDRELGEQIRRYYKALTFKILKGIKLSEFENNAMIIANSDRINTTYQLAVICSLPASYIRSVKRDTIANRMRFAEGGYIGNTGEKHTCEIEVLRTVFSQQWNVYFVSAVTDKDQAIFFSYKESLESGDKFKIVGTVKGHRDNLTQLNRVKICK